MPFQINSESGPLHEVILGSMQNFTLTTPINVLQQHYYRVDPPRIERLREQEERFLEVLTQRGITIHRLPLMDTSFTQFFVRDIAAVIGKTLVVCTMKEPIRQKEVLALEQWLEPVETPILRADAGFLEGGDLLIDASTIYVGLGERTNGAGVTFLEHHFGSTFEIIPLKMAETFLHLDVVVNLLGQGVALVYAPALEEAALELLAGRYRLIEVTAEEQFQLATNVFSLTPETLVSDERNTRLNRLLAAQHYEVITLPFDEIGKLGGSFRCGTCPLRRD